MILGFLAALFVRLATHLISRVGLKLDLCDLLCDFRTKVDTHVKCFIRCIQNKLPFNEIQ